MFLFDDVIMKNKQELPSYISRIHNEAPHTLSLITQGCSSLLVVDYILTTTVFFSTSLVHQNAQLGWKVVFIASLLQFLFIKQI